jgi:hypothetical protein
MSQPNLITLCLALAVPQLAAADTLSEPHVNIIPRTQAEAARIAAEVANQWHRFSALRSAALRKADQPLVHAWPLTIDAEFCVRV